MDAPGINDLDKVRRHLQKALDLMAAKRDGYLEGEAMYRGDAEEVATSTAIRRLIKRQGTAHALSVAHIPVDALFDRVELQGVTAEDGRANDVLTQVYDANDLDEEADDWHRKAGFYGDYYAIIDIAAAYEDGSLDLEDVTIVGSSPLQSIVIYDARTQRVANYGVKRWYEDKAWHALVFYDDATVHLVTAQDSTGNNADEPPKAEVFEPEVPDDGGLVDAWVAHPGGTMLIHHFAVDGRPYGTPVHRKAYGPQEAITKVHAINLVNVDGQGLGARWALQEPGAEIDDDMDEDFGTDSGATAAADSDGQTAVAKRAVRSVPGEIALLKGIRQVGQFDAANSTEFTGNLEWYMRATAVVTGTPLFEFDLNGEQPSGEARRRAEGRINKHARKVQRALGRTHRNIADTVLGLAGLVAVVTATFKPTEVASDKEGFELIALKIKTGVPIAQAFREAGYTDEQIDEWFPEGDPNVNLDSLTTIASALQSLGNARTLGVITDQELHALLPSVLTAAVAEGPIVPTPGGTLPGVVTNPSVASIVTTPPRANADAGAA